MNLCNIFLVTIYRYYSDTINMIIFVYKIRNFIFANNEFLQGFITIFFSLLKDTNNKIY